MNNFKIFRNSFKYLFDNPELFFLSLVLLLLSILYSNIQYWLNNLLQGAFLFFIKLFIFLSYLALASFLFSGMVGICIKIVKNNSKHRWFVYARKFWFQNLVIILIILFSLDIVRYLSHYGALFAGRLIGLEVNYAVLIFYLIYFIGLAGFLIFLTLSSFCLIADNSSVIKSIKKSFKTVKKFYFNITIINLFFFILYLISSDYLEKFSLIGITLSDVINCLFILPYSILILARFVIKKT